MTTAVACQRCIAPDCGATFDVGEAIFSCRRCGSLLDINYDWSRCAVPNALGDFSARWGTAGRSVEARADYSGVWRFRELLSFAAADELVTIGEGRTTLQQADDLAAHIGLRRGNLFLQYEGFNPSGSFKDNGMAAAFTIARKLGRTRVACASTGNTSASLALYAGHTTRLSGQPMEAVVFVGGGKIAFGKLAQALDYGAKTIQIDGDFDACMRLIQESNERLGLYVMNSINPFRLEGQKSIMYRVLEGLDWSPPDWVIVPGGNLGNCSAFGKAFIELRELGLLSRVPRLAVINAAGANTLHELVNQRGLRYHGGRFDRELVGSFYRTMSAEGRTAKTIASAIEIGRPVNLAKALRALDAMNGVVREASDDEILDCKALIGRHGYGCEPASAASVAGLRTLLSDRTIAPSDRVVCILTGHALKDADATVDYHHGSDATADGHEDSCRRPFANPPARASADIESIRRLLDG